MTDLTIEIERVVDRRAAADRIRHLEAQVDALRGLIALLERKLGERPGQAERRERDHQSHGELEEEGAE